MKKFAKLLPLVLVLAAAPVALTACSAAAGGEQESVSSVNMPLRVTHGGVTYALVNAKLTFIGTTTTTYNTNASDVAFNLSIAPGNYLVRLEQGWQLQKIEGSTTTTLSNAVLTSENPIAVTVVEQQVAPLTFAFDITGTAIKFGQGGVQVGVTVCDVPGACDEPTCEPTATSFGYTPVATEPMYAGSVNMGPRLAQTVSVASSLNVETVTIPLFSCKANGLADSRLSIMRTTAAGLPDTSQVLAQATVPAAQIADSCSANTFQPETFDFGGLALNAGKYALVLDAVGAVGGGVYWRRSATPLDVLDPYAGGTSYEFGDIIPTWQPFSDIDLAFTIDGVKPCN